MVALTGWNGVRWEVVENPEATEAVHGINLRSCHATNGPPKISLSGASATIFLAVDSLPGPFMAIVDGPSDYLWCRKCSPFATVGLPMQQPFRPSLVTVIKGPSKGPSKVLYLRHDKGKISCSSWLFHYYIHL